MRYNQLVEAAQQKDPNKMLALQIWSDPTIPLKKIGALGRFNPNNPDDTAKLAKLWYDTLQENFSSTDALNVTRQAEYKSVVNWLTERYIRGDRNFEDATSQTADLLALWLRLKYQPNISEMIGKPYPTDINSFFSVDTLKKFMDQSKLQPIIQKFKNQAAIERAKRTSREIILIDDDRFKVSIPLNYGACYLFNNELGARANYCTGSSSGLSWFSTYSNQGILINVLDKARLNNKNGKWQIHGPSNQLKNAAQDYRIASDENEFGDNAALLYTPDDYFSKAYPGLLQRIAAAMLNKADAIKNATKHSVESEIEVLRSKFPKSWSSVGSAT